MDLLEPSAVLDVCLLDLREPSTLQRALGLMITAAALMNLAWVASSQA